jgi:palmitoyl-protein thioesterase
MTYQRDTIVYPYVSQFFGERKIGGSDFLDMLDTELYKNDLIGLKLLHEAGKIKIIIYGSDHLTIGNDNFVNDVIPALYDKINWN